MLELRPNCELCDIDLAPDSASARICTYECTFCADCVDGALRNVCPNCGGGFMARPIRPKHAWRPGAGLANQPAGTERRHTHYTRAEIDDFVARLADTPPGER